MNIHLVEVVENALAIFNQRENLELSNLGITIYFLIYIT